MIEDKATGKIRAYFNLLKDMNDENAMSRLNSTTSPGLKLSPYDLIVIMSVDHGNRTLKDMVDFIRMRSNIMLSEGLYNGLHKLFYNVLASLCKANVLAFKDGLYDWTPTAKCLYEEILSDEGRVKYPTLKTKPEGK